MHKNTFRVIGGISAGVAAGLVGLGAVPAQAASSCPTPSALIAPGICQIVFTSSGTFTAPSGVTKLSAVVVGGGGGAYAFTANTNGAGAGQVVYTEAISLTGNTDVVVGAGGTSITAPPMSGESSSIGSSIEALGGSGAPWYTFTGAASGNGNAGSALSSGGGGGGGARTAATSAGVGAGYKFSEIPGVDVNLWPAGSDNSIDTLVGVGGLGNVAIPAVMLPAYGNGGGVGHLDGYAGVVIIRFAPIAEVLAETGAAYDGSVLVPGLVIASGISLFLLSTRLKSRPKRA